MSENKVAILTGAGGGIGRAIAIELARAGYRVVLAGRDRGMLEQTAQEFEGGIIVPTDVTRPDEVGRLIDATLETFGRIDALVNNAGLAPVKSIAEMSIEQWHAVIDTNLSAAFFTTKAVWPTFSRQKSGVVVNISSAAARNPYPGFAAYGAAKAGLNLFGLSAAREGQEIGVRVHTIAPSATETKMFRRLMTPRQCPPENTMDPSDVARVVLDCVNGNLRYSSGEVIYLHKTV